MPPPAFNVKLAQRFVYTLSRDAGESWREGAGMAGFIIKSSCLTIPVNATFK
jgi:hypothetical protein